MSSRPAPPVACITGRVDGGGGDTEPLDGAGGEPLCQPLELPPDGPPGLCLVVIDEETIDNDIKTIEAEAESHGVEADFLVNDDNPLEDDNPWLRWNVLFPGDEVLLPGGQVNDEGIFALPDALAYEDGHTPLFTYEEFIAMFIAGTFPQSELDKILNVTPLRNNELRDLVGLTCVAVVYDSDISMNVEPLNGNLQGGRCGLFAFTVLGVHLPGSLDESGSFTSLLDLHILVEPIQDLNAVTPFPCVGPEPVFAGLVEHRNGGGYRRGHRGLGQVLNVRCRP